MFVTANPLVESITDNVNVGELPVADPGLTEKFTDAVRAEDATDVLAVRVVAPPEFTDCGDTVTLA
jgi:hypothetical protein